jgi:hypothetical protein
MSSTEALLDHEQVLLRILYPSEILAGLALGSPLHRLPKSRGLRLTVHMRRQSSVRLPRDRPLIITLVHGSH